MKSLLMSLFALMVFVVPASALEIDGAFLGNGPYWDTSGKIEASMTTKFDPESKENMAIGTCGPSMWRVSHGMTSLDILSPCAFGAFDGDKWGGVVGGKVLQWKGLSAGVGWDTENNHETYFFTGDINAGFEMLKGKAKDLVGPYFGLGGN